MLQSQKIIRFDLIASFLTTDNRRYTTDIEPFRSIRVLSYILITLNGWIIVNRCALTDARSAASGVEVIDFSMGSDKIHRI
jgi:hypothetical protein